jgi:hypothetical protein
MWSISVGLNVLGNVRNGSVRSSRRGASTRPVVTARAMAVALLAARLETTPDDVERRAFGR